MTKYQFFGITIYKKHIALSSKAYYVLNICVYKKYFTPIRESIFILNIKIYQKEKNYIKEIAKYINNKESIYFCFHSGDFYYVALAIKQNFNRFKNIQILSNFGYLRQVLELLEFDDKWIEEHFVEIPLFYPSLGVWLDQDRTIKSVVELNHQKGWLIHDKMQEKNGKYISLNKIIANFMMIEKIENIINENKIKQDKMVMIMPHSQFNGNLPYEFVKEITYELKRKKYKILINTNTLIYDGLLDTKIKKVFLNYKDTYQLITKCQYVIAVRSGMVDCMIDAIDYGFVIYNRISYPHYKFFKNFFEWFRAVYSFDNIYDNGKIVEYFYPNTQDLLQDILFKIKEKENA